MIQVTRLSCLMGQILLSGHWGNFILVDCDEIQERKCPEVTIFCLVLKLSEVPKLGILLAPFLSRYLNSAVQAMINGFLHLLTCVITFFLKSILDLHVRLCHY